MKKEQGTIFWLEDNPLYDESHIKSLEQSFGEENVIVSAEKDIVFQFRNRFFDLLILDRMIHRTSLYGQEEKENICFPNVNWQETGDVFLQGIREGKYEPYGFPANIKVVVSTASENAKQELTSYKIDEVLLKPYRVDQFLKTIQKLMRKLLKKENRACNKKIIAKNAQ